MQQRAIKVTTDFSCLGCLFAPEMIKETSPDFKHVDKH